MSVVPTHRFEVAFPDLFPETRRTPNTHHPIPSPAFTEAELAVAQYVYDTRAELDSIFSRRNTPENYFAEDQG
jgi:hypothetical protein